MGKRKHWSEQESSAFKETKKIYEEGRKESLGKKDGVWRTVRGRHVFIEEGKTLEQALGHKPGVENQKKMGSIEKKKALRLWGEKDQKAIDDKKRKLRLK